MPALESAHALVGARQIGGELGPDGLVLVNLSGRGDKDIGTVADLSGADFYDRPSMRGLAVKGGAATSPESFDASGAKDAGSQS